MDLVRSSHSADLIDQPGGVFVRDADALGPEVTTLLQAAARVVLVGGHGPLAAQLDRVERPRSLPSPLETTRDRETVRRGRARHAPTTWPSPTAWAASRPTAASTSCSSARPRTRPRRRNGKPKREPAPRLVLPPAPWVNVVANPAGGFIVSEAGSGYTWAANSQANRLTPWSNDPVSDPPGEVVYLRDEETGAVWSPTPLPVADAAPVLVRHGQGYTTFERRTHGLDHELTLFVPPDDPVKVVRLTLTNHGATARRVSATYYAEWVLGTTRDGFAAYVVTEVDAETGALFARNPYNADFAGRVAFVDVDRRPRTLTGRPRRVPRPQRLGRDARGAGAGRPLGTRRRGARPLRGRAGDDRAGPRRVDRGRLPDRPGRRPRSTPATSSTATATRAGVDKDLESAKAALGRRPRRDPGQDARPGARPDGQPLARSTRPSRAASGAGRRSTSRAGPTGSATSSRTRWPWSTAPRPRPAPSSSARPRASSSRGTSSTGGTRPPASASARGSPTTISGSPTSPPIT